MLPSDLLLNLSKGFALSGHHSEITLDLSSGVSSKLLAVYIGAWMKDMDDVCILNAG